MPAATLAQLLAKANPTYSVVAFSGTSPITPAALAHIERLLKAGAKVHLVATTKPDLSSLSDFTEAKLLRLYLPAKAFKHPSPCLFVDGQHDPALLKQLDKHCPAFNYRQYAIEQASASAHLGIKAGAGTGKTATMVQRILFLLHTATPGLSPREIVMITFTREATHEMRQRLRKELVTRYRLTGQQRYLRWLEEVGNMPIKTIHAYTRELILRLGSAHGHSQDLTIRQFQLERKQVLEAVLNEQLPPDPDASVKSTLQMPVYEFLDTANRFWEEIENKGLSLQEMTNLQWGSADPRPLGVQKLFQTMLPEAERRLTQLKKERYALSLKDLTREVDKLRPSIKKLEAELSPVPRYLFVDEFQDTDNAQIKLVAWLQQELKLRLFVVGDIKQSIYRFRGANYTAFDELAKHLPKGVQLDFHQLTKNYRTGAILLDDMHPIFAAWNSSGRLVYTTDDQLKGVVAGGEPIEYRTVPKDGWEGPVLRMIRDALSLWPDGEVDEDEDQDRVAILVRTNRQARQIRDLCKEYDIPCQVDAGGDFWKTEAVTDFYHLVGALLYPDDTAMRINLHNSAYSSREVPWTQLTHLGGDPDDLRTLLDDYPVHEDWPKWQNDLRRLPVLAVLRRIVGAAKPEVRIYQRNNDEQEASQYSRNLGKLLLHLQETFPSRTVSLHAIHQYLALKRATDREEDQAPASASGKVPRLLCQTVHQAKGKQYHTVLIPFTGHPFRVGSEELLLRPPDPKKKQKHWKAGWQVNDEYGRQISNDQYDDMVDDEETETEREEARLLYVAMTRAEQRLWIARTFSKQPCWSSLLPRRQ